MKLRKYLAALLAVLVVAVMLPSTHAYALSDLDFTINVDNSKEYVSGYTVEAPIIIKTQNQKGYVELKMLLKYNADALSCETILNDWEGFTTEIVEEGLQITYLSPDGTPSKAESEYVLNIKFAVRTGVASGTYPLELIVNAEDVYSLDGNGNKENGKLTISDAKIKDLTIVETNDDNITQPQGDGSDPNYYFTNPSITQDVEDNGGGASAGLIIGIIVGALVVFAAGVVVGFILCQKRMTEDSYIDSGDRGSRYSGDTYGSGRRNIYDDDDDNSYTARRTVSRRPSVVDEDELVDTSYFGSIGDTSRFETERSTPSGFEPDDDDDDDEGFPDEFIPRNYGGSSNDDFGSYGVLGRRERGDDGYGSFEVDDDDCRSDRGRYR